MRCQYFEGVDLPADLGVDLPNLNSSWPQDVSTRAVDLPAYLGVYLPNLNSSWPQDVFTRDVAQPAYLGVDLPNLNSSWPWDVSTRGRSAKCETIFNKRYQYQGGGSYSRSRGRSAKFQIILTKRCQYWGIDLSADLGVDLPNLNSPWPHRCQYQGCRSASRSRGRSAKFDLILTIRCQYWELSLPANVGVDLPYLNSSWPQDVQYWGWLISQQI